MALTEAQRRALRKYDAKHYGTMAVKLPIDEISDIRAYIAESGDTLAGFIRRSVYAQMERDRAERMSAGVQVTTEQAAEVVNIVMRGASTMGGHGQGGNA